MSKVSASTLVDRVTAEEGLMRDAVRGSARAWVNFNGTGTVAIRASYNVTSITDNGTGIYTVNLTNAMPDANYAIACSNQELGTGNTHIINVRSDVTITTSVFGLTTYAGGTKQDITSLYAAIFR